MTIQVSTNPKVSVVLPVYNGEDYVKEAIQSVLNQTLSDIECIVVNDGSTDSSLDVIHSLKDPRIRVISNSQNLGLIKTLNVGLKAARGIYIARQDQDDISMPQRFEQQVYFLDQNLDYGVCGSWMVNQIGKKQKLSKRYTSHDEIKALSLFDSAMAHPTVMFRRSVILSCLYTEGYENAEDYKLWTDLLNQTRLYNLPKPLVLYRLDNPTSMTNTKKEQMRHTVSKVHQDVLAAIKLFPTPEELKCHMIVVTRESGTLNKAELLKLRSWIDRLGHHVLKHGYCSKKAFYSLMQKRWFLVCTNAVQVGVAQSIFIYLSSSYMRLRHLFSVRWILLLFKKFAFYQRLRRLFFSK